MNGIKVLVVGINPWVDNTGINTLITFFKNWGNQDLAHIYTRDGFPNTNICDTFFQISENRLIRSLYKKNIEIGKQVINTVTQSRSEKNQRLKNKKMWNLASLIREFIWMNNAWKSKELRRFIDDFSPDVLFLPTYSWAYMSRVQNYIADYTKCPVILYASDDNYSYKSISKTPLSLVHRYLIRKQLSRLFKRANKIMVIAPKSKEEYDKLFNTDSIIMTKGVDFSEIPYIEKQLKNPIKISYTGKLIYGRWKSLAKLSEAVESAIEKGYKVQLDIYTTDNLSNKQSKAFQRNGTNLKGAVPLSEVPLILNNSDIVVFAESLDSKYKNLARLSLSTKVTDYLSSGKCIFAIGDKNIAPIDYLSHNNAAIISTSYSQIEDNLLTLLNKTEQIHQYGRNAYQCGINNHNIQKQQAILKNTIESSLKN